MHKRYISGCLVLLMLFCDLNLAVRPAAAAAKVNVALNKAVTVSSEDLQWGGNKENAVDGKGDTKWSASSPTSIDHPHWLTVNLGASYNLSGLELTWKDANEVVKFLVEVSEDGNTWTPVADHSANDKAESQVNLDFEAEGFSM